MGKPVYLDFDASYIKSSEAAFSNGKTWISPAGVHRESRYALFYFHEESPRYGSVWSADAEHTVPVRFVCQVVGEVFSDNSGYMLEINLGDGVRWAIKPRDQGAVRLFTDLEEYTRLKAELGGS